MILITGASGNVGREVLKQVMETGNHVRAAFQTLSNAANAPAGVDVAILDYNKPETIRAALEGIERVFLVGPPTSNLPAMERNAVDQMKASGTAHVVKLSAMGGRSATFPRQHTDSEDYIKSSGISYTFLRPNGFMQNFVNYSKETIVNQSAFYGSQGNGKVSHIDIRDIAAVAAKTLTGGEHEGKTYTLTGPQALSNSEVAQIFSDELGHPIRYVDVPPDQLRRGMLDAGVPEWSADALLDLARLYREGGASAVTRDVDHVLGREPISFTQFVRQYRQAFQSQERVAG
jgi:uncharacterized protein YbjT (DUF2867 family)